MLAALGAKVSASGLGISRGNFECPSGGVTVFAATLPKKRFSLHG